jgi:Flp pilus assembly protein TadG
MNLTIRTFLLLLFKSRRSRCTEGWLVRDLNRSSFSHQVSVHRGQNLVEFALLLPLLVLVVFGVLDLGRVFFGLVAITNAARQGARAYTFDPDMTEADIQEAARDELRNFGLKSDDVTVIATCSGTKPAPPNCEKDQTIRVTVSYPFQITLNFLFPQTINLSRSIEMMTPMEKPTP